MQGTYSPGMRITLMAMAESEGLAEAMLYLTLYHLEEKVDGFEFKIALEDGGNRIPLEFELPTSEPRGYGVSVSLVSGSGEIAGTAQTAFDVLESWTDYPRYGFLTDFTPNREDIEETISNLAHFHINGLQFYDWQYRHDTLLSLSDSYIDPLGRELSLQTVREFIATAHDHGMAAMPYLAVYAASMGFWEDHPDWRLLDGKGEPLLFEDFLGLMDPSPRSPWVEHLLGECERTLAALNFDGLHIDQFGDPKEGFNVGGEEVDIPSSFHEFIADARERFPKAALTFNAVGNWPFDALASAPLNFNYIEIWPPTLTYRDLRRIVLESRLKSVDKPIVIALYLPSDQEANIRLTDAIIFASGGCRIELGEGERLLTDPYFPKHKAIPVILHHILRRYYDFAVRYGEWMGPTAQDVNGLAITLPEGVLPIVREAGAWLVLHLINVTGLGNPRWDEAVPAPESLRKFSVKILTPEAIRAIYWASPDRENPALAPAEWRDEGDKVVVDVPYLEYWTMVAVQIESAE